VVGMIAVLLSLPLRTPSILLPIPLLLQYPRRDMDSTGNGIDTGIGRYGYRGIVIRVNSLEY
jgi:hypothetical protein